MEGSHKAMATRRAPSNRELERYLDRGMTHREIAEDWFEKTGERLKPKSISAAISRAGLGTARHRYSRTLPWTVHEWHSTKYPARMLRALGRRLEGLPTQEADEEERLDRFLRRLKEIDAVVAYAPDTDRGFWFVDRSSVPEGWLDPEVPIVRQAYTEALSRAS